MFFTLILLHFFRKYYTFAPKINQQPAADQPSPQINYFNYYNNHINNNLLMYVNQNRFV